MLTSTTKFKDFPQKNVFKKMYLYKFIFKKKKIHFQKMFKKIKYHHQSISKNLVGIKWPLLVVMPLNKTNK